MLVAFWKYYRLVAARMERKTRKKRSPDHFVFGEYGVDITRGEEKARCPYSDFLGSRTPRKHPDFSHLS